MNKPTGGAAFPMQFDDLESQTGMTLRDYFAAEAMASYITGTHAVASVYADAAAREAYIWADAMLAERAK